MLGCTKIPSILLSHLLLRPDEDAKALDGTSSPTSLATLQNSKTPNNLDIIIILSFKYLGLMNSKSHDVPDFQASEITERA